MNTRLVSIYDPLEKDLTKRVDGLEAEIQALKEGLGEVKDLMTLLYKNN